MAMVLEIPRSRAASPGPRSELRLAVPKFAVVTGANAVVSNHVAELPTPCRVATCDFTWLATCVLNGALSDVAEAVGVKGRPEYFEKMAFTFQPPAMTFPIREWPRNACPLPNGSSAVAPRSNTWRRSKSLTARSLYR